MATFIIQHAFQGGSGLAEDRFVNTFHVLGAAPIEPASAAVLMNALETFYIDANTGSGGTPGIFGRYCNGIGRTIKIYNLSDVKPRSPLYTRTSVVRPLPTSTRESLPLECSVCLSYTGPVFSGDNAARRRGRIYLGPLSDMIVDNGTTPDEPPRVATAEIDQILLAATGLFTAWEAEGYTWSVYSPTGDSTTEIQTFWMDNEFDTQRRRGVTATARVSAAA